ncbi:glycosyltransferase family 4 protein [Phyllobacterium zundukense]|uniref:glycosyltransferase family 4 protein n=1 Tax=Phyllobacterium zundukense TaxID=1867719 RepID=UPI0013000DA1|nr:glycosyltransferase family 1 protein [Phyllobacterium zundukense]
MNKIWFDVTSILQWNRPAVGVIRVQAECAKYALRLGSKIAFCRFEREIGYIPVDLEDVRKTIERLENRELVNGTALNGAFGRSVPLISRIATITRRALGFMPKSLSNRILHYLYHRREAAEASINGLREFRRALYAWRNPVRPAAIAVPEIRQSLETSPFSKGDVHISLGLDWDQKNNSFIAKEKKLKQFKTIFCCYDVIPVKFPHLCVGDVAAKFAHYFVDLAWCADEFVSISECSKRDLLELLEELGAPCPETTVIKLGSHIPLSNDDEVSKQTKQAAGERFILFVSTIERRKNHETLYRAYTRLLDRGVTNLPKLVFVGMPGWGVNDFLADLRFDCRVKGLVQVLTNVSDADLNWLYKNTLFTVFPSLYEGWGLAVAESLSAGKFCLASNAASIPEVGGGLIEYLDPWDVPKWAERLEWYFDNPDALADAEIRIRETYNAPTWEETAVTIFDRAEALLARDN